MRKPFVITGLAIVGFALLAFTLVDIFTEPSGAANYASVAANYNSLDARGKQFNLWGMIETTDYKGNLPDYRNVGMLQIIGLMKQMVSLKGSHYSDFAPPGWKKHLHGRAAVAKIKIVPQKNKYTGIFQGADYGLLRLSLLSKVKGDRVVAPGLALKILRDTGPSANVSALVSLDGQGKDFNFFQNPMSNIVPVGNDMGQKMVHRIFSKASPFPEELLAKDMATYDARGAKVKDVVAPRQLVFIPGESLHFSSEEHDVRTDFLSIPEGTVIYHLFLVSDKHKDFDYRTNYSAEDAAWVLEGAQHVADIVSTSKFLASEFGDDGIFFRHELRE